MNNLGKLITSLNSNYKYGFEKLGPILGRYYGMDWKKYQQVDLETYNRNKVYGNNDFELFVITWVPGQESPVHDHPKGGCWLRLLTGELNETVFDMRDNTIQNKIILSNGPSFMHNDIGFHKIINKSDKLSTSLHLYSKV